jgi:osmotically-inducible protein OsmY
MKSKILKILLGASVAISGVSLFSCAATPHTEGTGEYVDDTVITAKVKTAILSDSDLKSAEINVETFKGRVQLSGFVSRPADILRAEALVRDIKGVSSVSNSMKLK